jgi:DNA-binding response OmpR family regulator
VPTVRANRATARLRPPTARKSGVFVFISSHGFNPPVFAIGVEMAESAMMVQRILIVDDENDFIELLRYKLAGHGYDLIVAHDGVHALSQARQMKPDLILLDILLPDLDGLSVCEILKRQPSTRKIPIIFMSALTGDVTKRTVAMHAEDFFTKPLDLPRLEKRIGELLYVAPVAN